MDDSGFEIAVPKRSTVTDPEEVFGTLTLRGGIENIWSPQGEALKAWHRERARSDTQVKMNTGGGKTLVGLLIGQSLVNETRGKVVYACPTNQLVEQTAAVAEACGIPAATLMQGQWHREDVFDESRGVCITNYAAVFTARSRFADANIRAIIFDDAHVGENAIRSQYTLRLAKDHPAINAVIDLFAKYFEKCGLSNRLDEARQGDWRALLFVPTFEMLRAEKLLREVLQQHNVATDQRTKFAWDHLKDKLDRCMLLLSGGGIEITPPVLPLGQHFAFRPDVRRVYLTASLPSRSEFVRVFGANDVNVVSPGGKSGDAQRLFLFLPGDDDNAQRATAIELAKDLKACIIAPSGAAADEWSGQGTKYDKGDGHAGIRKFADARDNRKLILAARYDGIDLPGDACRVLIIDGLPSGVGLYNRFIDETLAVAPLRATRTATRLTQAVGRIFRSNTDHGAVMLCGDELQRWVRDPQNLSFLPPLLQRQIQFGQQLRKSIDEGKGSFPRALEGVLRGATWWDSMYQTYIDQFETEKAPEAPQWLVDLAARERDAYGLLWEGRFADAAASYASLANDVEPQDERMAAFLRHWLGLALDRDGRHAEAAVAFIQAANVRAELGRPDIDVGQVFRGAAAPRPTAQAHRVVAVVKRLGARVFDNLNMLGKHLVYGPDTRPAEAAVQEIGNLLGLETDRPDSRVGTGPDVVWREPERKSTASLELKTDKKVGSMYTKKEDIGQYQDHARYVSETYPDDRLFHRIIGPRLRVSPECHPPDDLHIMQIEPLLALLPRLHTAYRAVVEATGSEPAEVVAQRWLDHLGLRWPTVLTSLPADLATDLQRAKPDDA